MISLSRRKGRLEINFSAIWLGPDLQILLSGGDCHIGATAICDTGMNPRCLTLPGHRENELACEIARRVSRVLKNVTAVTCGIHYDNISRQEIESVLNLCHRLTSEFLALNSGENE